MIAISATTRLIRLGGLAGVLGGPAVAVAYVLHPPVSTPDIVASGTWILIHALFMVSLIPGVFNLVALLGATFHGTDALLAACGARPRSQVSC